MNKLRVPFLLMPLLAITPALAGCPQGKDIYPQEGTVHPHWITDSGWISDVESTGKAIVKLRHVYIVDPPTYPPDKPVPPALKPINAILCSYAFSNNHDIVFNMHPPFSYTRSRVEKTNPSDWDNEYPTAPKYFRKGYFCVFKRDGYCEFTLEENAKRINGASNDPFDK